MENQREQGGDNAEAAEQQNERYDPSKDPKRRAKSKDPGWQYGFWPDLGNKDKVQCKLCGMIVSSGIKRLKQHLAGGFGDVEKCSKTTTAIMREMQDYLRKGVRNKPINYDDDDDVQEEAQEIEEVDQPQEATHSSKGSWPSLRASTTVPRPTPSSGTAMKRKLAAAAIQSKNAKKPSPTHPKETKSVISMLRKLPHEVVEERHARGKKQTCMEQFNSKVTKEDRERCNEYISDFFYSNGIPFNVAKSMSFEVMVEAIGQIGPGHIGPSYHELRKPGLQKAKKKIEVLRKTHELAWKEYGCTIMSDGWTDKRGRYLINFLANSPEGTFFLESVDASSQVADANMLADLLQKRIEDVGTQNVVQVITDNGANFKAAGRLLMARIPTLFWTPCAAHCIDLMLEEIGKIPELNSCITKAKRVTTFIYRHGKLLDAMRDKTGGYDLVRPAATRFATSFLTLQSLFKHRAALRNLFVDEDWNRCKLAKSQVGKNVAEIVLSTNFWNVVQSSKRATQPLVTVLRIVDGDENPAMPEVLVAMDVAKEKIKEALQGKALLERVIDIIERRWTDQMEVKLYGAALYLNPNKFYAFKEKDSTRARKLRDNFNDILSKMVGHDDEELATKISTQANHYEKKRACFGKALAISSQGKMSPLDWWDAYGGDASDLQQFAKRLLGLCASSSGCERNWSTFEFEHMASMPLILYSSEAALYCLICFFDLCTTSSWIGGALATCKKSKNKKNSRLIKALVAIGEVTKQIFKENPDFFPMKPMDNGQLLVISLGTGSSKFEAKYNAEKGKSWGVLDWLLSSGSTPLVDIFTQASADMVDIHIAAVFKALHSEQNYLRIQISKIEAVYFVADTLQGTLCSVDVATKDNLEKLANVGDMLLKKPVSRVNLETGHIVPDCLLVTTQR